MILKRGPGFQPLLITLTSTLLALSGCGKTETISGYSYYNNYIPTDNLSDAQRTALRTFVYCDDNNCNPSVSMLVSTTESNVESCTASLIGDDLALTNSHCIPQDLKEAGSDCSNRIYLFFPKTNIFESERAECDQVLQASEIPSNSSLEEKKPDYAFIRLKKPMSRPSLSLSTDGFPNSQEYTLPKVDPVDSTNRFVGALRNTKCKVIFTSTFGPKGTSAQSPVISFKDCAIEHGNSGSPILDTSGKVRGVIQARFEQNADTLESLDGSFANLGIGTNLSCVSMPEILPERALPQACSHVMSAQEKEALSAKIAAEMDKKLSKQAFALSKNSIPKPLSDVFEWAITDRIGHESQIVVAPKCFKSKSVWMKNYEWLFGVKGSANEEFNLPVWNLTVGINKYAEIEGRINEFTYSYTTVKIKFSPNDFNKSGASTVSFVETNDGIFRQDNTLLNTTLRACPTSK